MFEVIVLFISLTIAARVVDFPEPVGPVTKTILCAYQLYRKALVANQIVPFLA